jgi:2'-5' RNA ligase
MSVHELIRSFIALKVPPGAAKRIAAAQQQLRTAGADWKWVDPDSFHITLKFLGDVETGRLESLWRAAAASIQGTPAFAVMFRGIGAFPNTVRARVVWAGVQDGASELMRLASGVEDACAACGFERERRPFHAHLTLGRARRVGPNPALAAAIERLAMMSVGEAPMDRVLLMSSRLTRSGAIHNVLDEEPLAGRDAA